MKILTVDLLDLKESLAGEFLSGYKYPWEALCDIKDFIRKLGPELEKKGFIKKGEDIWVSPTAKIAETASITGPCIICDGAEIRHCAFIRGSALVGEKCVVGNSTELKNVILFNRVQVPHYNYVGDSILGFGAHMGAGAITSNVKGDKKNVTVLLPDGSRIETGIRKFGAILGDGAEIGCNTVLNPGCVIGRNTQVYPLSFVRGFVPENTIYKRLGEVAERFDHN